ncbi:Fic/DOC family protein [Paracidovorax anthurii]|uniref:Fic/DOC family protein n=2 Tax=Paracidovorax anthurii TaxID=78229 RepID=A0A328ZJ10_9BURK|nr:Fic/DOC family protein [Paracidovorax anthurii]
MDGALVAAHFKQNFIAIHPYMDGNGRVSRLLAERILQEFDLPAPDWSKANFDLNLSVEDAAQLILQHMPLAGTGNTPHKSAVVPSIPS